MTPVHADAICISDLHLGSRQCEADGLLHFLNLIRPGFLLLAGDVLDLQAMRHHAGCDQRELDDALQAAIFQAESANLFVGLANTMAAWLPEPHQRVLWQLAHLIELGVSTVLIPGNHDAALRAFCPRQGPGWKLCLQAVHTTPCGERLLIVHGDEDDALLGFHDGMVQALIASQETYGGVAARLRRLTQAPSGAFERVRSPSVVEASGVSELLLHTREVMLQHLEQMQSESARLERHGFSPAFLFERLIKRSLGHDRKLKRHLLGRLATSQGGQAGVATVIAGHTHVPEATMFALPNSSGGVGCGCHLQYYNDGSWARSHPRLGRTALVIGPEGGIGMVQLNRHGELIAYAPPRFSFNTYPMRACPHCGVRAAVA